MVRLSPLGFILSIVPQLSRLFKPKPKFFHFSAQKDGKRCFDPLPHVLEVMTTSRAGGLLSPIRAYYWQG